MYTTGDLGEAVASILPGENSHHFLGTLVPGAAPAISCYRWYPGGEVASESGLRLGAH